MYWVKRQMLLLLLMTCGIISGRAAASSEALPESVYRAITEDHTYEEARKADKEISWFQTSFQLSAPWMQTLAYIAVSIVLLVIVYLIVRKMQRPAQRITLQKEQAQLSDLEQRPMEADLEALLAQALSAGDYRLAFRIRYLMLIRLMHEKGIIHWKREKTNHHYVQEVALSDIYSSFFQLTVSFDRIWYGQHTLEPSAYAAYTDQLTALTHQLTVTEK
ncbi:MAG: hypothetical protein ABR94_07225 [Sphingobacteriales bacterium BACL12 MAG-120802-bin5]|jgi:hypothetical protein|nr:MAG: hypothetical protein ABR94_07225 [Sphingobacteriales bacterium BACL12 MAG-120802-bin5]